jgi:hypothetical protein
MRRSKIILVFFVIAIFIYFYISNDIDVSKRVKKAFLGVKTSSCGRYPMEEHITIDNLIWQVMEHPKGLVKILNAYLDLRQNKSVVRINVNSAELNNSDIFYCQFWFDDVTPVVVKATDILGMRREEF